MLIALALLTPPFASGPPEAMQPSNHEARLALVAGLSPLSMALLRAGFALEIIAAVLLAHAVLGLYVLLRVSEPQRATIAAGLGVIATVWFFGEHLPRFVLLQLASEYGGANQAARTALGAGNAVAETFSAAAGTAFSLAIGACLIPFGLAIRTSGLLSGWLATTAQIVGIVSVLAGLASLTTYELGFFQLPALLLVILWFTAAGLFLVRRTAQP